MFLSATINVLMGDGSVSNVHLACTGAPPGIRVTTPRIRDAEGRQPSLRPGRGSGERPVLGTGALLERWITNVIRLIAANTYSKFDRPSGNNSCKLHYFCKNIGINVE